MDDDWRGAPNPETTPTDSDPAPVAGDAPPEPLGRRQGALLVALAVGSVGLGFLGGRAIRERSTAPSSDEFVAAAGPTVPGVPLGGDHFLLGHPAPPFQLIDLATGKPASLADYAGSPVLVNFWATWCPPCRLEMPWLQEAYDRHAAIGLVVLAVDAGERVPPEAAPGEIKGFVDLMGLTFPVLYGPGADAIQQAWGVWGLPSTFLVDRNGTIVDAQLGMYPSQANLDARLTTFVGGS